MSRAVLRWLVVTLLLARTLSAEAIAQEQVRILVPVFSGDERLGQTSANLMRLQVSQTFQVAGTDTRALMIFEERPLELRTHEAAQAAGLRPGTLAHLVLWGQSYQYPDGVAVQPHLSTTPWLYEGRTQRPEIWILQVPRAGSVIRLRSELPRASYELPVVALTDEAARHYRDMDSLVMYSDQSFKRPVGRFRDIFRAHVYERDAVHMTSGGVTGWVPLPHLYDDDRRVVDFIGGYIRLLRGDWSGAETLFSRTQSAEDLSPEMAIDAHLFLGLIAEKQNRSGLAHFQAAVDLNPYDRAAATYLLLGRLSAAQRASAGDRASAVAQLRAELARRKVLFQEDSPWIASLNSATDALSGNGVTQ